MNAKKMLSDSGLEDLVLNKKTFPENTSENSEKWLHASDLMEWYAKRKVEEYEEEVKEWLKGEDFEGLAERL